MIDSSSSYGQPAIIGSTSGAAVSNRLCLSNSKDTANCNVAKGTLQYSTAMSGFYLKEGLVSYMNTWRGSTSTKQHKTNINYGETEGFMGAWIQKVFPCDLLPTNHSSTLYMQE